MIKGSFLPPSGNLGLDAFSLGARDPGFRHVADSNNSSRLSKRASLIHFAVSDGFTDKCYEQCPASENFLFEIIVLDH